MFTFFILFLLLSSVFVSPGSTNKNFPPFEKQITSLMTMRLTKVASYWLNFSFVDNRNFSFANVGFQFYVANNATDYSDGFANTPIEIKGSEVNYILFSNISALFESNVFRNGSEFHSRLNFSGPPYYGPPGYNYFRVGGDCGFPCIRTGIYVEQNTTGIADNEKAWSYWFEASNLIEVNKQNQNQSLPRVQIVVNMTVTMNGNDTSLWTFHPDVEIDGAKYSVLSSSGSALYVIYTGFSLSSSSWVTANTIIIVAAIISGSVTFCYCLIKLRKQR